jgi:two-component system sensor histidine kinase RegB
MEASSAHTLGDGPETPAALRGTGARPRAFGPSVADRGQINLSWLVHLHWWAILGQVAVIVAVDAITGIGLPVTTLLLLLILEVAGNFALGAWARRVRVTDGGIAAVMLLDIVVLTVLLDLTGGASNPFTTLYIVNVALAAVLLPLRWSWLLTAASLLGFAALFVHENLVGAAGHHVRIDLASGEMMRAHVRGLWLAFALSAVFVVFFVQRVSRALAERERELQEARAQATRRERLASLATLAAGAAHELSTPLSTIAVVAKEMQRALASSGSDEVRSDLQLVREQVARCRDILDRMAANAGENAGEPFSRFSPRDWIDAALDGLPQRERVTIEAAGVAGELLGPPRALADALRGMLRNALHATAADAPVTLRMTAGDGRILASVRDHGRGMPPEVLARVGEPFFTTKGPGEGMGLGLFLTRALVEQLGGEFHIASRPGAGTEAWIDLPAADPADRRTS